LGFVGEIEGRHAVRKRPGNRRNPPFFALSTARAESDQVEA
jgi:hypothetical protein